MCASIANKLKAVECLLAAGAQVNLADHPNLGTALILAATRGHLGVVNVLLSHKDIAVDQTDVTGLTALHWAATNNRPKVVACLLAVGARVNLADDRQRLTALMKASWKGHVDVVKALLADKRTAVDQVDASGQTALHWAATGNKPEMAACLLASGANVNLKNGGGDAALVLAVKNGHPDVVKTLLAHKDIAVDQADSTGMNALHWAAFQNRPEIVACLLQAGATVNMLDGSQRRTALILASSAGHVDVVRRLFGHKDVALNELDSSNWSALHLAAYGNKLEVVECLLAARANVNLRGQSWRTALMLAAEFGHVGVVKTLIRYIGFDPVQIDVTGHTALHIAVSCNKPDVVACLLAAGAHLKLTNGAGISAEMSAILNKQAAVLEVMMQYGLTLPQHDFSDPAHSAFYVTMSDLQSAWKPPVAVFLNAMTPKFWDIPAQPLFFIDELVACVESGRSVLPWLRQRDVRTASALPVVECVASLAGLWPKLANSGKAASKHQKRLICAAALNMVTVLTADGKALLPYKAAGISAAGVASLSTVATHQIEGLIGVSENVLTTLGNTMVNALVQACMAASASSDPVEIDALRARLVDAGWLAPVAQAIAVSWKSPLAALEAGPAALPASSSIKPASTSGRRRVEREAPRLFAQALLRELDSPSLIAALRTLIGDNKAAEPIDILFQAQCDQLRQFCEQTGGEG
jgi:ankyrin repeat protein